MALVKDIPETYRTTFQKSVAIVKPDTSVVLPAYLYYKLQNCVTDFVNRSNGSAQKNLLLGTMRAFQIDLHENFAEQDRVASILTVYDNLIENNQKQIKLLEEAAQRLYKEWFVDLRFPGYETTPIADGVPKGWRKKPLGDVAPLKYGKALRNEDRIPGLFPIYGSSGIIGTHTKSLVTRPTIIVGRKGNIGSVFWSPNACHPIDTVYYIDSERCSFFLYYALQHMNFINTDAAVPGLNRDFAHSCLLLIADHKILGLFEKMVSPWHQRIEVLKRQNTALANARDLLLPRLMSGEIEV